MSHGGSYGDEPWPSRSGASTWKRSASQSSASRRAWLPWLVTPCRKTTRGAPGSPPSLTSNLLPPTSLIRPEPPDQGPLHVEEEGAARRRAGLRVEDAVRLRGGTVLPEVRSEDVLCAELLLPCLTCCCRVAGDG